MGRRGLGSISTSHCHVCGRHLGILRDVDSGSGVLGWDLRCCLLNMLTGVCGLHRHTFPINRLPVRAGCGFMREPQGWMALSRVQVAQSGLGCFRCRGPGETQRHTTGPTLRLESETGKAARDREG